MIEEALANEFEAVRGEMGVVRTIPERDEEKRFLFALFSVLLCCSFGLVSL